MSAVPQTSWRLQIKSTPIVFEANGKEREARQLHSTHISSVPLTANWILDVDRSCDAEAFDHLAGGITDTLFRVV